MKKTGVQELNDCKAANLSSATKHMYMIVWQYYETENLNMNGGILLFLSTRSITFLTRVILLNTNFVTLY
jgi:hypothetical protein